MKREKNWRVFEQAEGSFALGFQAGERDTVFVQIGDYAARGAEAMASMSGLVHMQPTECDHLERYLRERRLAAGRRLP